MSVAWWNFDVQLKGPAATSGIWLLRDAHATGPISPGRTGVRGTAVGAISILEPVAAPVDVTPLTIAATFSRFGNGRGHDGERESKSNCFKHGYSPDICVRIGIDANVLFWSVRCQNRFNEKSGFEIGRDQIRHVEFRSTANGQSNKRKDEKCRRTRQQVAVADPLSPWATVTHPTKALDQH